MSRFKMTLLGVAGVTALATLLVLLTPSYSTAVPPGPPTPSPIAVTVTNVPLLTTLADSLKQPFREGLGGNIADGEDNGATAELTIPAGKRFVIEHVSLFATLRPGQTVANAFVQAGGTNHVLVAFLQGPWYDRLRFAASQPIHLYADSGSVARCAIQRYPVDGTAGLTCELSGYLVDLPAH